MRFRGRSEMNKPATALLLFFAGGLLLPGLVSSQSQTKAGDSDSAPRGVEADQNSAPAPAAVPSDKAQVTGLRFLSSKAYTRVMLDLSQEASYEIRQLKEDAAKGMPPRIYIDIAGARLALTSKEAVPVEDGLLRQIRIGQFSPDVVRVVLDMHSLRDHNAFILPDPYRLVVDLQGQKTPEASAAKQAPAKKPTVARKPQAKQ